MRSPPRPAPPPGLDGDAALAAYNAVRPEHCRRVLTTAREWGELWHLVGAEREWRNAVVRARDVHDYGFVAWLYGPTALTPHQLPSMFARAAEPEPEDPSPFRPLETAAR